MKKEQNEITVLENEMPVISILKIDDTQSLNNATEILSKLNKYLDRIVEYKKTKTDPLNQALKVIRAETKPLETKLEEAILSVRKEMSRYQGVLMAERKAEEAKIADRVARGTLKVDTAIKKMENLPEVVNKSTTDSGSITFKETQMFEVVSLEALPLSYHLPNEVEIRNSMKAGVQLPGVRYYTEQVPINRRK